jgi:hypothetical protein
LRPLTRDLNSGEGAKDARPDRVRACPGACLGRSPTRAALEPRLWHIRCPAMALAWSGRRPGDAGGLPPPAPVSRRGLQDCRAPHLRDAHDNTQATVCHAHRRYVMNRESYPRARHPCSAPHLSSRNSRSEYPGPSNTHRPPLSPLPAPCPRARHPRRRAPPTGRHLPPLHHPLRPPEIPHDVAAGMM